MMGQRAAQGDLFRADHMHLDFVGAESFYGWLATEGTRLFTDEDFSEFYTLDNGRPSTPPSQLLTMLLLQGHDRVSDREAIRRSRFDLCWKVALGLCDHEGLCVRSTLQKFRAMLNLSEKGRWILKRSVEACRQTGVLKDKAAEVAIDTTPIWGRGAVKDTYNLVADGITLLLRALAELHDSTLHEVAREHGFERFVDGTSLKGEADIDWADEEARNGFLNGLVADGRRALELADEAAAGDDSVERASGLLKRLIQQDTEEEEATGEVELKRGVARDRIPSAHDPEQRHGRKSKRNCFVGHKGEIVVETESGTILDASVKPGNANDAEGSLAAVERAEESLKEALGDDAEIVRTAGDCAYGTASNRRDFADADRELDAKQPRLRNGGRFTKEQFPVDPATGERVCPAGHRAAPKRRRRRWRGERVEVKHYRWPLATCESCPLRDQCMKPKPPDAKPRRHGRTVSEHPEERLLAAAREQVRSPEFRQRYRRRTTVEHSLARMVQLGARQARYIGRMKTEFQWQLTAAIANLTKAAAALVAWLTVLLWIENQERAVRAA